MTPAGPAAAAGAGGKATTIWLYEKSAKIYPRSVSGRFARWRWAVVALTQLVFYGLPWLVWNSRPALLFDLEARRFYIGPLVLYPQDFIYLTVLLLLSALGLFLFTAVAGRLWCGFACPQTVYTEIFMAVERWFEGDRQRRQKLDASRWTWNKLWRKGGKHAVWIAIGLWTGFTFVGYFTPIRTLWAEAFTLDFGPWEWFWVCFYGFATWGNAGFMREQVCKYMCPYARFQSAMFDRDTLVVAYDTARGEPRGSRGRGVAAAAGQGDCIACTLCVQVCPTGIDIREGLQYECIGCAACVDVCDEVMDKVGSPRGLIRFATENGMAGGWSPARMWQRVGRPRVLVYGVLLLAIAAAFVTSLAQRLPFRVDVLRERGTLARLVEGGAVENSYRLHLMNASEVVQRFRVTADGLPGLAIAGPSTIELAPTEAHWMPVALRVAPETAASQRAGVHPIRFTITLLGTSDAPATGPTRVEASTFVLPR